AGIISGENGTLNRVFQYVCPPIWRTVSSGRTLASWLPLPAGVPPPCYSDEWCSVSAPFRAAQPAVQRQFDKRIHIPLPDSQAMQHRFKVHLVDTAHS
uniref:Uncharacterized protein n=2 Tax=Aegilops tauschii subsp. strangulata TaxID=200361 RepID=A0A453DVI9_AEGTS